MADTPEPPKIEDLGEGPERRMQNFPPPPPAKEGPLGPPPGPVRPPSADAAGDNDTDELAENVDDATLRLREKDTESAPKVEPPAPHSQSKPGTPP